MTLNELATAMQKVRDRGFRPVDVIIMNMVQELGKDGPVPVMDVVQKCTHSSPATVHEQIKSLVDMDVLKKVNSPTDLRLKHLEKGEQFNNVVQYLTN